MAKSKPVVSSSSESSSSDSDVPVKKTTKVVAKKAPVSDSSSDSSDSSDSDVPVKKTAAKRAASDSDSSDSDSSDEEPAPKKVVAKTVAKKVASDSESSSSSDSDSSDSDSEDEAPVKKAAPRAEVPSASSSGETPKKADTVFVGGLPYDTTEDAVTEHFSSAGAIASIRMPTFPDTGRFRGVAFITFETEEGATAATKFNETNFGSRYLIVKLADGRGGDRPERPAREERGPSVKPEGCKTVFVGGLSFQATEDDLRAAFDGCGTITSARVAWDRDQDRSKGFGYVDFEEDNAVDSAIKLTGTNVAGRPIRVDYSAPRDRSAPFGGGRGGGRGGGFGGRGRGGSGFGGGRGGSGGFGGGRGGRGGFGGFGGDSAPRNKKFTFDD